MKMRARAMAEPAILSYLMDETLEQLAAQLTQRAPVRSGRVQALDELCRCGLNPLIAYFGMGELSLLDLLAEEAGEGKPLRVLVSDQWGRLAQREIDALCGACVRPCASSVRKPRAKAAFVRPRSAGSRQRAEKRQSGF